MRTLVANTANNLLRLWHGVHLVECGTVNAAREPGAIDVSTRTTLKQVVVRDVATYIGHHAATTLSTWIIGSDRTPLVTGRIKSIALRTAIDQFGDHFMGKTGLCELMHAFGSDKGLGRHNYAVLYATLLAGMRMNELDLFELGIGTNDTRLKSNMGKTGKPGASLYAWREYLPRARIVAADIDSNILFRCDRIECYHCDQTSESSISALWDRPELQSIAFDLMIDDGLHEFEANKTFMEHSYRKLRRGGLFIVEDILTRDRERWIEFVHAWNERQSDASLAFVQLPHAYNFVSNNIACLERH
jgi:hypothetical protein